MQTSHLSPLLKRLDMSSPNVGIEACPPSLSLEMLGFPNPPSNLIIWSEINGLWSIPDHQQGTSLDIS
jgi:hypothetical protein